VNIFQRGRRRSKRSKRSRTKNLLSILAKRGLLPTPTVPSAVEEIIRRKYDKAFWLRRCTSQVIGKIGSTVLARFDLEGASHVVDISLHISPLYQFFISYVRTCVLNSTAWPYIHPLLLFPRGGQTQSAELSRCWGPRPRRPKELNVVCPCGLFHCTTRLSARRLVTSDGHRNSQLAHELFTASWEPRKLL
jgi:hypothetical protein